MRFNENEVVSELAFSTPDWEGKLTYKPPKSSSGFGSRGAEFKERWFRLKANCLFYWRMPSSSSTADQRPSPPAAGTEPLGCIILEGSHVQQEGFTTQSVHAFSIVFADEPERKHLFLAETARHVMQWVSVLKKAKYA